MTDKPLLDRLLLLISDLTGGNKKRFAEILGLSPTHIDNWINKGSLPSAEHLSNIQDKLNVSVDWLLTGKGERYIKKEFTSVVKEAAALYGTYPADEVTAEERAYIKKLIRLFHTKQEKTVNAIKQNIDAFLDTPNKTKAKKSVSNG